MGLPAGMGTSAILDPLALEYPLRSKYVLLTPADRAQLQPGLRLVRRADTLVGTLYENVTRRSALAR